MTTYSAAAVTDAVIAYQKPITLQQGRALRDNPLAQFEGATGAPGLWNRGLSKPLAGATPKLVGPTPAAISITNTIPANTSTLGACTVLGYGTARFFIVARRTSGSAGEVNITRNRAGVSTVLATLSLTGSDQTLTVDASFTPMDNFLAVGVSETAGAGSTQITSNGLNVSTDGTDFWVCSLSGPVSSSLTNTAP